MQSPDIPDNPKANTAIICLSPYHGGMEMDAIRTARLLKNQTKITVILKQDSPSEKHYRSDLVKDGFRVESIPFNNAFSLSIIHRVRRIIKNHEIRNVIFFGASELRSLYFSFLGLNINLIVRHGTTKSHPKKDPLHRLIYSKVDWHIAICEHIARNVRTIIPFGKHTRMKLIYPSLRNPITKETFTNRHSEKRLQILHVGRVTGGKGQIDAILACQILHDHKIPFRLRLVGDIDPTFRPHLEDVLSKIPYRDSIECTGHTDSPDNYFQNADIFLFPSKGEGLSNAFIEALSYGLYCIAYANTSFPELQTLGFELFLAGDKNLTSLQLCLLDTVKKCLQEPLQQQNRQLALKLFNPERERNDYLSILK